MYIAYYDCGTTNTRAYLLKDGEIRQRVSEAVGIKDFAFEKDKRRLVKKLHEIFESIIGREQIASESVSEIWLSGMISSPSGLVEIEHIPTPVSHEKLKESVAEYHEDEFFRRTLKIIPGIRTLKRGEGVQIEEAPEVNIMRGEETEIFGVLHRNPALKTGDCVLILPGSHTHAVLLREGVIEDISSNVTGELFNAIRKETILGASITGDEEWKINGDMVRLGAGEVHRTGFNKAIYTLRILDLFTKATLNDRRSYLEGVLNVGVMDSISCMIERNGIKDSVRTAVAGDSIQRDVYNALNDFHLTELEMTEGVPYSVEGILSVLGM